MSTPLVALVGYAVWTILLVLGVFTVRSVEVLRGRKRIEEFRAAGPQGAPFAERLHRAHLNATENLPVAGAVMAAGVLGGVASPLFGTLALVVLGGRIAQSLAHVASLGQPFATLRATAFFTQQAALLAMAVELLRVAAL